MSSAPQPSIFDCECCEWRSGEFGVVCRVYHQPVEPMAPATVEVDLRGDAGAAAGELEAGCGGAEMQRGKP